MTAVEQINAMVKQAQIWGHFAPAHSSEEARAWHNATVPLARKAIKKGIKGAAGAAMTLPEAGRWLSRNFLKPAISDVSSIIPTV